jgi:acetylornithine deacetylase/succinyl-diaminopimelate desuccinylase-like protein
MRAVTSMTDADGTVVIEGFRDGALAPTEEQLAHAAQIPLPTAAVTAGRMVLEHLGAPVVSPAGTLRPDGNMHGPDEHGAIADYLDHVRFTQALLERLAEVGGP